MFATFAAPLAAVLGSTAGGLLANAVDGGGNDVGKQITDLVNEMNGTLQQYMNKAIDSSTNYTNQGVGQENTSLNASTTALTKYLQQATTVAQQQALSSQQGAQAALQPMLQAGGAGRDALMDSLGLSRPIMGSYAVQNANLAQQQQNAQKQIFLGANGQSPTNPGTAPTVQSMQQILQGLTPDQIQQYIAQNTTDTPEQSGTYYKTYTGYGGNQIQNPTYLPGGATYNGTMAQDDYIRSMGGTVSNYTVPADNYILGIGGSGWLPGGTVNVPGMAAGYINPTTGGSAGSFASGVIPMTAPLQQMASQGEAQQLLQQQQAALKTYNTNLDAYNTYQNNYNAAVPNMTPMQQAILNAQNQGLFNV